jgi:diguanylate cyclase (GGDEF)-like protein
MVCFIKRWITGGASLYYSSDTIIGPSERWKARNSEYLDPLYSSIVNVNPIVDQVYFNSWDNMNRLYPFVKNPTAVYGTTMRMQDYNFYYLADAQHNPERKAVWTTTYLDPAGMGWMVSAIAPVYNGDFLEGVLGLDITLSSVINVLFDEQIVSARRVFLLDQQQTILAMTPEAAQLIGVPDLTRHPYKGSIKGATLNLESYQLSKLKNKNFSAEIRSLIESSDDLLQTKINGIDYLITSRQIDETGWQLFMLQDVSEALSPLRSLERIQLIVSWCLLVMMLFITTFYLRYVSKRSRQFSESIVKPINQLAKLTAGVGKKEVFVDETIKAYNIKEVADLVHNFAQMTTELDNQQLELIKVNSVRQMVEEKARLYQIMANTDQLTGLHNRKYLDTILRHEGIKANRYSSSLSLMLFDIDHFKSVNDNFGHQMGDLVLKKVAKSLKGALRDSDVLGRWGGEEFLLVCINTSLTDATALAEKLRTVVELLTFDASLKVTVSIGVVQLQVGETTEKAITRADAMLYRSKHGGRNQVSVDLGN